MLLSILSWLLGSLLLLAVIIAACLMLATWWIAAKAERLVPALGKFIEIDGNRIHYVEEGEGRPIVFLHGLARSSTISAIRCLAVSVRAIA